MNRSILVAALALAAGGAHADGLSLGAGLDYSSGDYGSDTTTTILSVPVTARLDTGNWTFKASLPWLRVDGDPGVLPGVGSVTNTNPRGRGRGGLQPSPTDEPPSGAASGVGDLRLAATYAFDTGGPLGIDLTGNAKIATADEDKGLGTGASDLGLALDLYRQFDATLLFGGVSYTWLGDSDYVDVDDVAGANIGASWTAGRGNVGVAYDFREAASFGYDDRSELTGFYGWRTPSDGRVQVYALKGLSDGSPDWGAGVSYRHGF
ncbi:hypothetical protein N799_13595 [Lysobacter arseniciresistens ZS79]|uniref:Transporter n=1 Tax=Lysobacter arseniciresistens ZS79 TaxID=913325 RepID=A0A0A0ETW5_9GAMM|nr:hypothetical protein [Lysobacter arseniciresistens]KGM53959.1 hypothetical protein N799_13595 [Lysobacter arseniciresistens ZS79]